jgi:voltage-gated potassium channel
MVDDERRGRPSPGRGAPPLVARPERRPALRSLLRSLLTVTALVLLYYLLPLDRAFGPGTITALAVALVLLTALVALQIRSIIRSPHPALRAFESLALTVPLFLLVFAMVYALLAGSDPRAFNEPLSRTDSLYFVVTVFATVGFGDITPVSQLARVLVTVQMVSNLLVLGLVVRAVMGAVRRSRDAR